jgi:tetratricopeptide (TPR) repeat protein
MIANYGEGDYVKESCRYLSEYHRNRGDLAAALVWMEKLFAFEKAAEVSFIIAEDYEALGDTERELHWLQETIALCPTFLLCYLRAAELLKIKEKWVESVNILQKGFEVLP